MQKNKIKIKRIFQYFRPDLHRWILIFLGGLLLTVLSLINPLILKFLIDDVLINKNLPLLKWLMLFFIALRLFSYLFRILFTRYSSKTQLRLMFNFRNQLFHHLEKLKISFFEKHKMGDILTRLTGDIRAIEEFAWQIIYALLLNIFSFIFILGISFYINWKMTLVVLAVIPIYVFSQNYFAKKVYGLHTKLRKKVANLWSFFEEKLSSILLVHLLGREEYEYYREKHIAKKVIGLELKSRVLDAVINALLGLISFSAIVFILWYGGYLVIQGKMTIGLLIAIYAYLGGLFGPIEGIAGFYTNIQKSLVSMNRVFKFLDVPPQVKEEKGEIKLTDVKGEIEFKNVFYQYNENIDAVHNLTFHINPGEHIGLVGPSGAGKTTIAGLLVRLFEPQTGKILIDQKNTQDVQLTSLREAIGLISQDVTLFNASIFENIAYGKLGASHKEVIEAAKKAKIHDFIMSLPKKYKTQLGEKGVALSGGQKQRIALARMILHDPAILIFDEATSHLDAITEKAIQNAVNQFTKNKTNIIIAHRLRTMESVDRLIFLENGKIIETGSFADLMGKKGSFHEFYTQQYSRFHQFQIKLMEKINQLKTKQKIVVIRSSIKNLDSLISRIGQEETDKLLKNIEKFIPDDKIFGAQDPRQKGVFYFASAGEGSRTQASAFVEELSKEWPLCKFNYEFSTSKTESELKSVLAELNA